MLEPRQLRKLGLTRAPLVILNSQMYELWRAVGWPAHRLKLFPVSDVNRKTRLTPVDRSCPFSQINKETPVLLVVIRSLATYGLTWGYRCQMADKRLSDRPKCSQEAFSDQRDWEKAPEKTLWWCAASICEELVHCWEAFFGSAVPRDVNFCPSSLIPDFFWKCFCCTVFIEKISLSCLSYLVFCVLCLGFCGLAVNNY